MNKYQFTTKYNAYSTREIKAANLEDAITIFNSQLDNEEMSEWDSKEAKRFKKEIIESLECVEEVSIREKSNGQWVNAQPIQ